MIPFCRRLVARPSFERFIIGVILASGVLVGLETLPDWAAGHGMLLHRLSQLVLAIFVLEAAARIMAAMPRWTDYFRSGWNLFDFSIIVLSFLPGSGEFAMVARLVRLLRVLRLVSALPRLRVLVATLVRCIPGMGNVILLMALLFYIYAVAGVQLYATHDPEHWGNLGAALITLFQIVTLEGWVEVMRKAMELSPWHWLYFISFVVIGTFVVINLFIAVVINSLEDARSEVLEDLETPPSREALITELRRTREQLARLERRLG